MARWGHLGKRGERPRERVELGLDREGAWFRDLGMIHMTMHG